MHIIVLIKQVPETDKVSLDVQTGTMIRSGNETIINPLDLYAIEEALILKEHYGAQITVLSMGPPDAERALRETLAMGCDSAILLTDRAFAGSDTWATSRVLALAIKKIGDFSIVLAGERATDGETGQVGPEVAAQLGLPVLTYVSSLEIEPEKPMKFRVKRFTEEGYQELIATPPCVIAVVKEIASPRLPTLRGKKHAREAKVLSWGAESLGLEKKEVGLLGSPTRVAKIFYPKITRNGVRIIAHNETEIEYAVSCIISRLESKGVFSAAQNEPRAHFDAHASHNSIVVDPLELRAEECQKPEFWILAEFRNHTIDSVSFELLARARELADCRGARLVAIVLAPYCAENEISALIGQGADSVVLLENPAFEHFICEPWAIALASLANARKPEVFLGAATSLGRTLLPYLAALLGTGLTADCTELSIEKNTGRLLQTRPAIGGNIMATIRTVEHLPQMATVRPHSTQPLPLDDSRKGTFVRIVPDLADPRQLVHHSIEFIGLEQNMKDFENLEGARCVVSGGRGLKKSENFHLIRELAHALDAHVGASRESVDRGWISYPHQIGLSGKTISPDIYLCAGISGAIQHLAGIRTAKTIISINSDPEAPINAIADLAIVGDLFEIVPRLTDRVRQRKDVLISMSLQRR